jgi:bacterioferritin-associated ferredoxin
LAQISDSRIRSFAVEEITGPDRNINAVQLLQRNFEAGDEQLLCDFVEIPDDPEERHSLLMDIQRVLQENMESRVEELAQVIYFHTPCAICRDAAIELLEEDGTRPAWMAEEAMHDSQDSYRKRQLEQAKVE